MNRLAAPLAVLALCIAGCRPPAEVWPPLDWSQLAPADGVNSGLDQPDVVDGRVRVALENQANGRAETRVTMRTAGQIVHFTSQTIPGGGALAIIGPDRADSILVEVARIGGKVAAKPPAAFFLGRDFTSGDTIRFVIAPEDEPPDEGSDGGKPQPLAIAIEGLAADRRVAPGMAVQFDIVVTGALSAPSFVSAFADPDATPDNGNEIAVTRVDGPASRNPVRWTVPPISPGRYLVYAELHDADKLVRSRPAAGAVVVNAPPAIALDAPRPDQLVTRGRELIIAWAGSDADDDAMIAIFLDTNEAHDGVGELILRTGIREDDVADRELALDTASLDPGVYFVGGLISDGLVRVVAYAGPIEITPRLVGRFTPDDLDRLTELRGGPQDRLFGAALDCTRSLNAAADARADLLIGSPRSAISALYPDVEVGAAYYFQAPAAGWLPDYSAAEATLRITGEGADSATGRRVALIEGLSYPGIERDVLLGAPTYTVELPPPDGRAYYLSGQGLLGLIGQTGNVDLATLSSELGVRLYGEYASAAGLGLAALGDVNGNGRADFAVGAIRPWDCVECDRVASVYLFFGGRPPLDGMLGYSADFELASVFDPGDLAGYAIAAVPDADGNEIDDFAVGAPRGRAPLPGGRPDIRPGVVYLILSQSWITEGYDGPYPLGAFGQSPNMLDGRIFVGENDGDLAGAALAAGDFDADGRPDLLIGAPGYAEGRGRVYLVADIASPSFPQPPAVVALGLVGTTYPGAIFDGLAVGGQLGLALAAARDFDGDGIDDVLLGAPGAESGRGSACLIYGDAAVLRGTLALADLGTRPLPGWELVGPQGQVSRVGEALSAGDTDGDGRADVAIGAPGNGTTPGAAYLLPGYPPPPP